MLESREGGEVVPEHWSNGLEGACTMVSLAGIVMIAREGGETRMWRRAKMPQVCSIQISDFKNKL